MAELAGWGVSPCVAQKNRHFYLATDEKVQRYKDGKLEFRAEQVSARRAQGSSWGSKRGGKGRAKGKYVSSRHSGSATGFDASTMANLIQMSKQWNAGCVSGGAGAAGTPNACQCFNCNQVGHVRAHCPVPKTNN